MSEDLSLKYRPKKFADLMQPSAVRIIQNSIENNRLSQFYIFDGPRGSGKTSLARLIAMYLTCENTSKNEPCGKCKYCNDIIDGRLHADVIEINASVHTGKQDIASLVQSNVNIHPILSDKKVYILDECHKMSDSAQSSLLKVLEEPPSHAVFIFCTTEIEKVLDAIIDRALNLKFNPILIQDITNRLKYICKEENIKIKEEGLELIAYEAEGSMRKAIKILQSSISDGDTVDLEHIEAITGRSSSYITTRLLTFILKKRKDQALYLIESIKSDNKNINFISVKMCKYLIEIFKILNIKDIDDENIEWSESEWTNIKKMSKIIKDDVIIFNLLKIFEQNILKNTSEMIPPDVTLLIASIEAINFLDKPHGKSPNKK